MRWRRWPCARVPRSSRHLRCRSRTDATGWSTRMLSSRLRRIRPMRYASLRSGAPTCWRCTFAAIRSCGCGCIAGGAPMPEPRVLIVAPNWLGDAVMALPALADVRRAYPNSRLVVAARPSIAPLYAMVPGVDQTIVTEWRGSLGSRQAIAADVQRVQTAQVDLAILFPNSFASAWGVH